MRQFHMGWTTEPEKPFVYPLRATIDATGLTQQTAEGFIHIPWSEVTAVFAYKKDCFLLDSIRVVVSQEGEAAIECSEDDQNLEELADAIERYLPESLSGWHSSIITSPPFATSLTKIYPSPPPAV